ncbi:hypothetical protein GPECTOR_2181g1146 [Gonium pectorale]|uniref:Uncharacterized protein n=1 Tax=Gonium pectorale TaxID=33097 RepID=A0A150FT80_GONPE|nr:hypothetical protein GPECTOR_2181g1146 [Gonium pectorale]|eukprot:KXZ40814.1 hypothetical protein GPECTOR_2181g1146 [Gonium pectorale]
MEPTEDAQQHGMYSANVLRKMAGREANTQTCSQCGTELHMAPFIRSLRLDEQAARWGPDQQEGDSEGCRSLRHLLAGIELHADWLAAAAGGGQGQQQGGLDAGTGGGLTLPDQELLEARRELVHRVVALHRLVATPKDLPLLAALLPPPPPPLPAGAAAGSGEPSDGPGSASSGTIGVHDTPPPLRLRLVCEHPDGPHLVEGHPGYDIPPLDDAPAASWLRTHARGLRPLMRAMELMWRHGPQEAQGPAGASGEAGQQVGAPDVCQMLSRLQVELERLEVGAEGGDEDEVAARLDVYVSCQEARRSIEEVIKVAERKAGADGICGGVSGPLTRVVSRSGAVMWLCPCHLSAHAW